MSRDLVEEVFENYGYIDMDNAADDPEDSWLRGIMDDNFITYKSTGKVFNGWPEYRLEGPYSRVRKVVHEYWNSGDEELTDAVMYYFIYDNKPGSIIAGAWFEDGEPFETTEFEKLERLGKIWLAPCVR
jgi:hypothetical protein